MGGSKGGSRGTKAEPVGAAPPTKEDGQIVYDLVMAGTLPLLARRTGFEY